MAFLSRFGLLSCAALLLGSLECGKRSDASASSGIQADRILIEKSSHRMKLFARGKPIATYQVALGRGGLGPKQQQGDHKTPEGQYFVDGRKPASRFYRALHISYPNAQDRARTSQMRVNPGEDIEIHGLERGLGWLGRAHRMSDWTDGCIAVTDSEMDEIWNFVPLGTPVEIQH